MYKLVFFVPDEFAEQVKEAIFVTGAGQIGNYAECCWQTSGTGQFRPLTGSDPFIGRCGEIERVSELRIELVCADEHIRAAVAALRKAHPYEEPAYDVWRMEEF